MIFKDRRFWPTEKQEIDRYRQHIYDLSDAEYRNFLGHLVKPLLTKLSRASVGLDFGCGTEKTMEVIFREQGISCFSYDLYFFCEDSLLQETYDFIVCSETAEHFFNPHKEFEKINLMLKPGGWLGLMTQYPPEDFKNWWYHRDFTHVVFYPHETRQWIADKFQYKIHDFPRGVTLFQRP